MRDDPRPEFEIAPHDVGFAAGAARKAEGNDLYWRIAQFLLPNHALTPNALPGENIHGQTAGVEPAAARNADAYRVRGGSIVAERGLSFADVMTKRFGDPRGRVAG